jgi:peptidoglycan L-alanyl-D-glutamate endopeptidase CwlK
MSAQGSSASAKVNRDLNLLAPRFREGVELALDACRQGGLDAMVYEGYRSQELQAIYYARGRTIIPPTRPVTNAPTNPHSWHGFGLAVDVIHRVALWSPPGGEAWFEKVAQAFLANGCKWGGHWRMRDLPQFQWHLCRPSPSEEARALVAAGGLEAVWAAVDAG